MLVKKGGQALVAGWALFTHKQLWMGRRKLKPESQRAPGPPCRCLPDLSTLFHNVGNHVNCSGMC